MSKSITKATEMIRNGADNEEIKAITNLNLSVIQAIRDSLTMHHLDKAHE